MHGVYDAKGGSGNSKDKKGFVPGGASLHSCMTPHGPDNGAFSKASAVDLKPHFFDGGLAFMFESALLMKLTQWARDGEHLDRDYYQCWQSLPKRFDPKDVPSNADHIAGLSHKPCPQPNSINILDV